MGSNTNTFETSILNHIFNNGNIADIGDSIGLRGSSTAGSLYIGLANDTLACDDATPGQEAQYPGYARVAVARTSNGWIVSGNQVYNKNNISFPTCTAGTETIRYVNIFTALTGGARLYYGKLSEDLIVTADITPHFAPGSLNLIID